MRTKVTTSIMAMLAVTIIGAAGTGAASAAPGGIQTEHLRFMNTMATSARISVIATGGFTAGGYVIPAAVTDTAVFPGGTFKLRHVTQHVKAGGNPRTCLLTETLRGTFTIGHGTGKYAGIRGSGTFVTSIAAVTTKDHTGQCTHVRAPATYQEVTTASGTVSR
jgi:hypothetical protein